MDVSPAIKAGRHPPSAFGGNGQHSEGKMAGEENDAGRACVGLKWQIWDTIACLIIGGPRGSLFPSQLRSNESILGQLQADQRHWSEYRAKSV
jgi:hypothetical protein